MKSQDPSQLLSQLQSDPGMTLPEYQGSSIVNLPDSVCSWFGIPPLGIGSLKPELLTPVGDDIRHVVLLIIDALSLAHFQRWTEENFRELWKPWLAGGTLNPITSLAPSTTCAALTSFWTGQPAVRHGISGYEMWLKEYQLTANMIRHVPASYRKSQGGLELAGFDPESFLDLPLLGSHLLDHGIQPHIFQHRSILHSGLSRMFLKDVNLHGISTSSDMFISIREQLEANPDQPQYLAGYWGMIDSLFHLFGTEGPRPAAEFEDYSRSLIKHFWEKLPADIGRQTLVILTADHGQITTTPDPHYTLSAHPPLEEMLHMLPTGENRLAYLYVRPGQTRAVKDYVREQWPDDFFLLDADLAAQSGLFGPPPRHPEWRNRTGDLILVARGNAYLWWPQEKNPLIGRHGGLSTREMTVPLFTLRL